MLRILLVDDDEGIRSLLADYLNKAIPTQITTAQSGNQAIHLLESGFHCDAIVSDYNMADGTGADLLTYLNEKMVLVPFVLFSSEIAPMLPKTNKYFYGAVEKFDVEKVLEILQNVRAQVLP